MVKIFWIYHTGFKDGKWEYEIKENPLGKPLSMPDIPSIVRNIKTKEGRFEDQILNFRPPYDAMISRGNRPVRYWPLMEDEIEEIMAGLSS